MNKAWIGVAIFCVFTTLASADEPVLTDSQGRELRQRTHVVNGKEHKLNRFEVVEADGSIVRDLDWPPPGFVSDGYAELVAGDPPSIRVKHEGGSGLTVQLAELNEPGIESGAWAIRGNVRYENVVGTSYFEMWSYFADGSYFFSRTMVDGGPQGWIAGSSSWRRFEVPFDATDRHDTPVRITLNLVMKGVGTVEVGPLELVQLDPAWAPVVAESASHGMRGVAVGWLLLLLKVLVLLMVLLLVILMIVGLATARYRMVWVCVFILTLPIALYGVVAMLFGGFFGLTELIIVGAVVALLVLSAVKLHRGHDKERRSHEEPGGSTDDELRKMQAMDSP